MPVEIDEKHNIKYYNRSLQLHREDGPAIIYVSGTKQWWQHGELHREDGPAVILANGYKFWYLDGIRYDRKSFNKAMKKKKCP